MNAALARRVRPLTLGLGLFLLAAVPACEAGDGEPSLGADADASTTAGDIPSIDLSHDDGPTLPEPDVPEGPSAALELAVTDTGVHELFPDVGAGGIVFMRLYLDESRLQPEQEPPDCMQCTWCNGCRYRMIHYDPATGTEGMIAEEERPQSAPRITGNRVIWLRRLNGNNEIRLHDLETGQQKSVQPQNVSWINAVPILRGDKLYWHGYIYGNGYWDYSGNGIIESDIHTGTPKLVAKANVYWPYYNTPNWAQQFGRPSVFATDGKRAVWAEYQSSHVVLKVKEIGTDAEAQPKVFAQQEGLDFMHPALDGDAVVWKSYVRDQGCNDKKCELTLRSTWQNAAPKMLSEGVAEPSRYSPLTLDGGRVYWLDFRGGPYAVYRHDLSKPGAEDERLTSSDALLSAHAAVSVHQGRLVWMDRRTGNWDIYQKVVD